MALGGAEVTRACADVVGGLVCLACQAMIIHAFDGSRIACALLSDGVGATLAASAFVPYYTYDTSGGLAVAGSVSPMSTSGTTQTFAWSLSGVDPQCSSGAGTAANSCGIHIHSGRTCTDNAGGHYYETSTVTSDPWTSVAYTSDGSGVSTGSAVVTTGGSSADVTLSALECGHAMRAWRDGASVSVLASVCSEC